MDGSGQPVSTSGEDFPQLEYHPSRIGFHLLGSGFRSLPLVEDGVFHCVPDLDAVLRGQLRIV